MDEKISLKALEDYSDDYASKITASFFAQKEIITGPDILSLCETPQVNLFVVAELSGAWKVESDKLWSPFFDYTHPEVEKALKQFNNLLSNHISISRENFQPLLRKAVSRTLYILLDPYDFYSDALDKGNGAPVKVEELEREIKYMRINRAPLEKLLDRLKKGKSSSVPGKEAFAMLDNILEEVGFTPEEIDPHLAKFLYF